MNKKFDSPTINDFCNSFLGYGNPKGDYWFIGMEEGGGNSYENIEDRLTAWTENDKKTYEDLYSFHQNIKITNLFKDPPRIQATWSKLIRIILYNGIKNITNKEIGPYQVKRLGRDKDETLLLELLPLPSPSTSHWIYGDYSDLPYLKSRKLYRNEMLPIRIKLIKIQVKEYRPKVIVFYGLLYKKHWEEISDVKYKELIEGLYFGKDDSTIYFISKHPAARGVTNKYFDDIGEIISEKLNEFS